MLANIVGWLGFLVALGALLYGFDSMLIASMRGFFRRRNPDLYETNRAAGLYASPEFRKQIRRISIGSFAAFGIMPLLMFLAVTEGPPVFWWVIVGVLLIIFLVLVLILYEKWEGLMRKGVPRKLKVNK